jgi:2,4-dienoyl-CoA reductase-like NADH-dependent reductase (Old Yellow Enzyme family)
MLIRSIENFLSRTGLPATKFGRLAVRDPRLVADLRNGREPRKRLVQRVEHFMNHYEQTVNRMTGASHAQ